MKRVLLIVLVALCALVRPVNAYAQADFLDWLESFSGPGPFHTTTPKLQSVSLRAMCVKDDGNGGHHMDTCFLDDMDSKIKALVGFTFSWTSSHDNPRFSGAATTDPLNTLPINASRVEGTYSYRVHPMLDVGVAAGVLVFTGDGFEKQVHPVFTPLNVTFLPLGLWRRGLGLKVGRVFRVQFAERYVFGNIDAKKDYGSTSSYLTRGEFNPGFSFGFDILPLFAH